MAERDRSYVNLSEATLIRILDHIPEEQVKVAMICERVLASIEQNPERLWEDEYGRRFGKGNSKASLPEHKIEWFLDAVDIIGRSLQASPDGKLTKREIEGIIEVSGLFDRRYVNPEVKKLYESSENWKYEKSYQDNEHGRFIGPQSLQLLVTKHSRFSHDDLDSLLLTMERTGHIVEHLGFPAASFHLASKK